MSGCYPTGCNPCTGEIDFPDNPINGQRYCKPIDAYGAQKCWVWDKCIPGWRAEGPPISPTRYRGLVNVCVTKPDNFNEKAGDFVLAKNACALAHNTWGLNLGPISVGDRVIYDGANWAVFAGPEGRYASEALDDEDDGKLDADGKPDPDTRDGGIVKNATVLQALAGTDKCDTITPFTMQAALDELGDIPDFTPTKPNKVTATISPSNIDICANAENTDVIFYCSDIVSTKTGIAAIANVTFQWREIVNGTASNLDGETGSTLSIESLQFDDGVTTRSFDCVVTATDLFGGTKTDTASSVDVNQVQVIEIINDPQDLDLSGDVTEGDMSVTVGQVADDLPPLNPTYQWRIDGFLIEDADGPDSIEGYSFANFNTRVLTIKVEDSATAVDHQLVCEVTANECTGLLTSEPAQLTGPGEGDTPAPSPDVPSFNGIGSYRLVSVTRTFQVGTVYFQPFPGAPGNWRCDGFETVFSMSTLNGAIQPYPLVLFVRVA